MLLLKGSKRSFFYIKNEDWRILLVVKDFKGGSQLNKKIMIGMVLSILLIAGGCGKSTARLPVSGGQEAAIKVPIINTDGHEIGKVDLTEGADGVTIAVKAEGLPPGKHGIHIHEKGECTPPLFETAGGHFNPTEKEHGFNNLKGFHLGDLPNVEVDAEGKLDTAVTTAELTLASGKENSILDDDGSALVIHANEDDYKTDPSGNSGDRIACAVIQK